MDKKENLGKPSPRLQASFSSKLFYCWLMPFFFYGIKNDIEPSDLYDVLPKYRSEQLADRLERFWISELAEAKRKKRKPSLLRAIIKDYGSKFALYGFFISTDLLSRVAQPLIVKGLISYFDKNSNISKTWAYIYFTANIICTFVYLLSQNKLHRDMRNMGMCIRIACSSLIYRKILRLPQSSSQSASGGKIINLLSNDVTKFDHALMFLHHLWAVPIQVIIISYIMWGFIGIASIGGIITLVALSVPLQVFCGKMMGLLRREIAGWTDERIMLMGEIIHGIRVIKMYTWEGPFERIISVIRSCELKGVTKLVYIGSILSSLYAYAQRVSLFVAILISVFISNNISAALVFTLVQYFNLLHLSFNIFLLKGITFGSLALASIDRIKDFLLSDELMIEVPSLNSFETHNTKVKSSNPFGSVDSSDTKSIPLNPFESDLIISVEQVDASWTEDKKSLCLNNVNISIDCKKLYAISGPVGAGKSSLLKLILREIIPLKGEVNVKGTVSYASQEPWLFSGSIRNNILFGAPYDSEKYQKVTKACALYNDFVQLPSGDKTLVGDNGANLSGGQRARVNLARAVYRDADIYLLDDPLSAVDNKVCQQIHEMCMKDFLKDKTCLLVTHQLQCMKDADEIILFNRGQVEFQGTYSNLQNNEKLFESIISQDHREVPNDIDLVLTSNELEHSNLKKEEEYNETSKLMPDEKEDLVLQSVEDLREIEEAKAKKMIPYNLYFQYFKSGNPSWFLLFIFMSFTIAQILYTGSDYYLAYWVDYIETSKYAENAKYYPGLCVMGLFLISIVVISVIKLILFGKMLVNTSNTIHSKMIFCLMRANTYFFDTNNSGRILNRFSKDLGVIDEILPPILAETYDTTFIILGVMIQVIIIDWRIIIPTIILVYIVKEFQTAVLSIVQDLRRIEGNAKSPVLAHTKSSISGIITIRSSKCQKMVHQQFDIHQNYHTAAFSMTDDSLMFFSWFADLITIVFLFIVTLSFILLENSAIPSAMIGLAICQIISVCGGLQKTLRIFAEISMQMVAVERLFQYTKLEQESPLESSVDNKPPGWWPDKGKIDFKKLSLRYSENSEEVLKQITFTVEPGTRIGIVGRTGAGKSSLIAALFRFTQLEGTLTIDKIDTQKIGLVDLRKKLSILPQEPALFSLSLRENLDPYKRTDDDTLWSVLGDVEMKKIFCSLDNKLDFNNLTPGQRQLLCLARVILSKNRIIIFDEATANIDDNTDALIQKTIRNKCKNCTVLTIAHRLNTIIDSDKVLVIDAGRVVEYDHPHLLLQEKNGYFSKMVQLTGDKTSKALKKIAEENFKNHCGCQNWEIYEDKEWFHNLARKDASNLIELFANSNGSSNDGYFLVRPSISEPRNLCLVLWYKNRVQNIIIRKKEDSRFSLGSPHTEEQSFCDLEVLVLYYKRKELTFDTHENDQLGKTKLTETPPKLK